MKIGILTFHNSNNYGAVLQTYATYIYLEKLGHDVEIIDYQNNYEGKNNRLLVYRNNYSLSQNLKILVKNTVFRSWYYSKRSFNRFMDNLKKSVPIKEYKNDLDYLDIIIVGSDQLWNSDIFGGKQDKIFLLDFEFSGKKISYATSMGSKKINPLEVQLFKNALDDFSALSVRENFAKKQLEKIGIRNIKKVCDPTMLLTKEEWINLIKNSKIEYDQSYMLVYLMTKYESYQDTIKSIADFYGLKIVFVTFSNIKRRYVDFHAKGLNPFEFLYTLLNSKLVVTNSFHGTIFSILLNKEFIALYNEKNPMRVIELLEELNLETRLVSKEDNIKDKLNMITHIDYDSVNNKISKLKKESGEWLNQFINHD